MPQRVASLEFPSGEKTVNYIFFYFRIPDVQVLLTRWNLTGINALYWRRRSSAKTCAKKLRFSLLQCLGFRWDEPWFML